MNFTRHITIEVAQIVNKHMRSCSTLQVIREMTTKTTMNYYFIPTRMAKMKKTKNTKYWQRCGTTSILMGRQNEITALEV